MTFTSGYGTDAYGTDPFGLGPTAVIPFQIISAVPTDNGTLRVTFSKPTLINAALRDPSSYVFSVRFGRARLVYAREVILGDEIAPTYVDLKVLPGFTNRGQYRITSFGIVSLDAEDLVPPYNAYNFVGVGCELKAYNIVDMLQPWYNTNPKSRLLAVICAMGEQDASISELDLATSAIREFRDAIFLGSAKGEALSVIGTNFGIPRPSSDSANDELYRALIKAIAFGPRGTMKAVYAVIEAFFGPQAIAGWKIFEPGLNTVVVQANIGLVIRTPTTATYLHPDASVASSDTPPGYPGDYIVGSAFIASANQLIKGGLIGTLAAGPGNVAGAAVGSHETYPASLFPIFAKAVSIDAAPFTGNYASATPGAYLIRIGNSAFPRHNGTFKVGSTFSATSAEFLDATIEQWDNNLKNLTWKLSDMFSSAEALFVPEDVGAYLHIQGAANPTNNRVARIVGYVSPTTVAIEEGATPIITEGGPLAWQVHQGVGNNPFVVTGDVILQDLKRYIELVQTLGVVVIIGDVTT